MLTLLVASLAIFSAGVMAAPPPSFTSAKQLQQVKCSIAGVKLPYVAGVAAFAQPDGSPSHIFAGIGVQNYTCANTGTYVSVGAVAELFDASCLSKTSIFKMIPDVAFASWKAAPPSMTIQQTIAKLQDRSPALIAGQHYFITNPLTGSGISPIWDARAAGGGANGFVVASKIANVAAPTGTKNVDWLVLGGVQGSLATKIFRTDTRGGQPPASCTPGSSPAVSIKYASMYYLYGGAV